MSLSDARPPNADRLLDSLAALVPFVRRDVVLRNYDDERAYDLTLRARDADEETLSFERRYRLEPSESRTERAVVAPGAYVVTVDAAEGESASARCRVGAGRARTIRVETGNSVVSVSDGVS